jgi:hypothetical protein
LQNIAACSFLYSVKDLNRSFISIDTSRQSPVDPLFVISNYGSLVEFNVDIQPLKNSPQCEDMPFQAVAEGKGRWIFCRLEFQCTFSFLYKWQV